MARCRMCGWPDCRDRGEVRGYRYEECPCCGLIFAPGIGDEQAWRYARGGHHDEGEPPENGWADEAFLDPAFRLLGRDRDLRILDFGCGDSDLPDRLRARGNRTVGIDLAPPKRRARARIAADLEGTGLPAAFFDLVYAYQVFEHLTRPRETLRCLLELVRPGGLLAIHTDMETPERGDFARWWYVLPPHHCAFYRHRTFERALAGSPHAILAAEETCVIIRKGEAPAPALRWAA